VAKDVGGRRTTGAKTRKGMEWKSSSRPLKRKNQDFFTGRRPQGGKKKRCLTKGKNARKSHTKDGGREIKDSKKEEEGEVTPAGARKGTQMPGRASGAEAGGQKKEERGKRLKSQRSGEKGGKKRTTGSRGEERFWTRLSCKRSGKGFATERTKGTISDRPDSVEKHRVGRKKDTQWGRKKEQS